ncbi:hypothetical protein IP70_15835 [alpha proteobacterium AAP38]|nr:hypothetical protein IP70_15835 [alpha proteobacterium AAP38]
MAEDTKIEWADHTFNPWMGCTKLSDACANCYAEKLVNRFGGDFATRQRTSPANWSMPLRWNARAMKDGTRPRVFCASLADVFDNQVAPEWRQDLWNLIRQTPHLDWLLLTKRPQNIAKMLPADWGNGWPNVWLGTTVENQTEADRRIPNLLAVPAVVRFLSCEPLLGPIDLHPWLLYEPCPNSLDGLLMDPETGQHECCHRCDFTGIGHDLAVHWVIVGGESGPGARPMHPDWARSLRDQCVVAGVPFLFKQWGEWAPNVGAVDWADIDDHPEASRFWHREWNGDSWGEPFKPLWCDFGDGNYDQEQCVSRVGKKAAGRLLDGRTWDQFPKVGEA